MKTLEELIEAEMAMAVDRVVRLSQRTALAAFERRLRMAVPGAELPTAGEPLPPRRPRGKKSGSLRRSKEEIDKLSNRFLQLVRTEPGQAMSVLAPRVGVTAAELQVPVARLKAAGKLKTVGRRHLTRYFPVADEIAA